MALDELFIPHMPSLYRAAAQVLRHPQDSEDALQEGLLAAFSHLDQFQGRSKFSTWLHSIVVNAALLNLRRRKREVAIASTDDEFDDADPTSSVSFPDHRPNPEEEYSSVERSRILEQGIRELPAALSNCPPNVRYPGFDGAGSCRKAGHGGPRGQIASLSWPQNAVQALALQTGVKTALFRSRTRRPLTCPIERHRQPAGFRFSLPLCYFQKG